MMLRRILGLGLVALVTAALGCATERPTRSYVQPNYLSKDVVSGEWYMRQTVTDVPATTSLTFQGEAFGLEKVRWEVQEKWLVAYRSYELIPGSTREADQANKGTSATRYNPTEAEGRSPGYKEAPIAAFPIDKHFDIFRQYNSTTGEELNVLEENDKDHPWYERKYMRVDWSGNQVVTWGTTYTGITPDGSALSALKSAWYVQESEGGRDRFRIDSRTKADGASEAYYFDFVTKAFVEPEIGQLWGCILGEGQDCASTEIKLRTSFLKVDGPRDFEPVQYDDRKMAKFGYFRTERLTYNRDRGITQSGRVYLANVHNVWAQSIDKDAKGNRLYADAAGQQVFYADDIGYHYRDASGKVVLDSGRPKAPSAVRPLYMPKEKRPFKPIVYHLSPSYPKEMIPAAEGVAASWNKAFRNAAAIAQNRNIEDGSFRSLASCETAKGVGQCAANTAGGFCKGGTACEPLPDLFLLNYNGWVKTVTGFVNPFTDYAPLRDAAHGDGRAVAWAYDATHEKFQAGDLRYSTMYWIQQPQVVGPLGYGPMGADPETGEVISGTAYVYGAAVDTYATMALDSVKLLNNQTNLDQFVSGQNVADFIAANRDRTDPRARIGAELQSLGLADAKARMLGPTKLAKLEAVKRYGFEPAQIGRQETFQQILEREGWDKHLVNEEIRIQMSRGGYTPGAPMTDEEWKRIDVKSWSTPNALTAKTKMRWNRALKHSLTLAEFADDGVLGLAMDYAQRAAGDLVDGGKVWQDLRGLIFRAVMEHEVGHTLGLRHNFQGSFDSLNYFDEYWQLRQENIAPAASIRRLSDALAMQQVTPAQSHAKMGEYQYSTVMDYGARFNSDIHGVGKYDMASIAFAYAGAVEVFSVDRTTLDSETSDIVDFTANKPSPIYDALTEIIHYTQLPYRFGNGDKATGIANIKSRRYVNFDELQRLRAQAQVDTSINVPLEVPYMFCSDDWIGAIGSCQLWDAGADHSEITRDISDRYQNYYFFNNYKRDRHPFTATAVLNRVFSRYLSYLPNMYQHWLFSQFYSSSIDGLGDLYWTVSTFDGLNLIAEVLTKPLYGQYALGQDADGQPLYINQGYAMSNGEGGRIDIPRGEGRRLYSRYDLDSGYYLFDRTLESGHFWEFMAGIFSIVQSDATVLGVETASDFTSYSIPYYLVFEEEVTRLMNGLFAKDYKNIAPRLNAAGQLAMYPAVDINGNNAAPAGTPIDLETNFTQQIYAILYSMGFFTSSYSLHYPDQAQIFRLGGAEAVTPGEGYRVESFTDPLTGHAYGCFVKQTGDTNTLASKLVVRGKSLAEQYVTLKATNPAPDSAAFRQLRDLATRVNDVVGDINILRPLYATFGRTF